MKFENASAPSEVGKYIHDLLKVLWPINRSITGSGVRETLRILKGELPSLNIIEVPSGTQAFDWVVPDEWNIRDAWIADQSGRKVVDFADNNLHLVGYSEPVDEYLDLSSLQSRLYSLPEMPGAIPYVTSYYERRWGFCLSHAVRSTLNPGTYHAYIDADLKPGSLSYGELILPGEQAEEVLLSTYICHPSMANNELSGPGVVTALARWLAAQPRRYTYRLVFVPETIGAIVYLSKHLQHLKKQVVAGYCVTCVGDERAVSYLPSRATNTLSDMAAKHVLARLEPSYKCYSFLDRGSDERQYCAPGVDLPIASVMRSKYGTYAEYHTSLDDLEFVTPSGLARSFEIYCRIIEAIEENRIPQISVLCEPQLGKRGLYPNLSEANVRGGRNEVDCMMNLLAYADGKQSLIEIADLIGEPIWRLVPICQRLQAEGLLAMPDRLS